MPQQRWLSGSATSTPLRSSTATAALPIAGALYSTLQVANSATLRVTVEAAVPLGATDRDVPAGDGRARRRNHVENVGR